MEQKRWNRVKKGLFAFAIYVWDGFARFRVVSWIGNNFSRQKKNCGAQTGIYDGDVFMPSLKQAPFQILLTLWGKVSLYGWPPVFLVWILLLCLCWIRNIFTCLVESKLVKQEVSCTVILAMVSVLWHNYQFWTNVLSEKCSQCTFSNKTT